MSGVEEVEDPGNAVGGYAPALHFCPHADANIVPLPYGTETKDLEPDDNKCTDCDNTEENWLCLTCHTVHCGRFASSHARKHSTASGHLIACGLADLSFWCYQCDSYLHHLTIQPVYLLYRTLHVMKFGEETVDVMEFTQPGVFKIEEEEEGDNGSTAGENKEANEQGAEPLSLSAGMGGSGGESRMGRPQDEKESKSEAAPKDDNIVLQSVKQ